MKKILWSALLAAVGLLTGCSEDEGPAAEYGTPYARYKLSGRTVASETAAPIRGIRVRLNDEAEPVALSDSSGNWALDTQAFPCGGQYGGQCTMTAVDADGPANGGEFDSLTVSISPHQTGPGAGHWYEGTYEQSGILFELHKTARK